MAKEKEVRVVRTRSRIWPLIAGLVVFFLITRFVGHIDHLQILGEVWRYVTSGGAELITWPTSTIDQVMLVLGYALIGIPIAIGTNIVATILVGKRKGEYSIFSFFPEGMTVNRIFTIILLEEVFARWLFQGVIGNWLHVPFIIGLIGNAIWAGIHITNWPKEDRQLGRTLPQFVAGFIMMAVYAIGGFWWALLVHFTYDAILFAMDKRDGSWGEEIAWGIYHLILAGIAGLIIWLSGANLAGVIPWLQATETLPQLALSAFQIWVVITFIDAVLEVALSIMGYDINAAVESSFGFGIGEIFAAIGIYISIWFWSWIGGWFGWTPFEVAIIITLLGVLGTKIDTLSSLARSWFRLPIAYLTVCVFMTHGFWTIVLMLIGWNLVGFIPAVIRTLVREEVFSS